jgi:hypothetical protein
VIHLILYRRRCTSNTDGNSDKPPLGRLIVATALAATSAMIAGQAPDTTALAARLQFPTSSTLHLAQTPVQSTPLGRAVEVAMRTGVFVPPTGLPTATATTVSLAAPIQAADTITILPPTERHRVTATSLASSSLLNQQLLGALPARELELANTIIAADVSGTDSFAASAIVDALRTAVLTQASGPDRMSLVHEALVRTAKLPQVMALSGVSEALTPRQATVLRALAVLDGNEVYAYRLVDAVVATLLDPANAEPAAQQAALTKVFADRTAYIGVTSNDSTAVATSPTFTDEVCSAAPARTFRVGEATAHPLGCERVLSFTRGDNTVDDLKLITPPTVSTSHPSVLETGRALALVDDAVRSLIDNVVLNPEVNPEDAHWRSTPGFTADHVSFMTASTATHTVHVYPIGARGTGELRERLLAGTFTHEAGHMLQEQVKQNPTLQTLWVAAVASDDVRASSYAFSSDAEDFAESFTIFATTRGAPAIHQAYRELMPARFAAFDAIVATLLNKTPAPAVARS